MPVGIQCDSPVPTRYLGPEALESLSQVAGDVCFYSCFFTSLLSASTIQYEGLVSAATRMGNSFLALVRYTLEQVIDLTETSGTIFQTIIDGLQELATNGYQSVSGVLGGYDDFAAALWAFIKGEVSRYFQPLLLASVQRMVTNLESELTNRATLLQQIELKLTTLQAQINALAQYDWWDKFCENVIAASRAIRNADREVQNARLDANTGVWDPTRLGRAENHMLLAWRLLSSDDAFNELLTEIGDQIGAEAAGQPPNRPFEWSFRSQVAQPFMDDLQAVADTLEELKADYDCLFRISSRMYSWQVFIVMAASTLNTLRAAAEHNPLLGMGIDFAVNDDILEHIHDSLFTTFDQMRDVVENQRRASAPIYNMQWRNDLKTNVLLLTALGAIPDPFGIDFVASTTQAADQLNYIVYPHVPIDRVRSLSEYDFAANRLGIMLETFIVTVGHIEELMSEHATWNRRFQDLRNMVRNVKRSDQRCLDLLQGFTGYEDPKYDYIMDMLNNAGWSGAARYLETGQLEGLLHLAVTELGLSTLAVECISNSVAQMLNDSSIAMRVNAILEDVKAEDVVSNRSAISLPAFQFKAFLAITNRINEVEARIAEISDLQGLVCG